jgi:RNA-directed DNA polymerase
LDAKTATKADAAQAATPAVAVANGPEDEITDWLSIDWQQVEDDVRRLRQRIFTATQAGDLHRLPEAIEDPETSAECALRAVRPQPVWAS